MEVWGVGKILSSSATAFAHNLEAEMAQTRDRGSVTVMLDLWEDFETAAPDALTYEAEQVQRPLPAQALLASAHRGAEDDRVPPHPALAHLAQQGDRLLPLAGLLAGADGGVASDNAWRHAQVGGADDYRALVCVFLYGGNDAFNMLVPHSLGEHTTYADTRRSLAIAREDLLPLNPANSVAADYGLHPQMQDLKNLFDDGK